MYTFVTTVLITKFARTFGDETYKMLFQFLFTASVSARVES